MVVVSLLILLSNNLVNARSHYGSPDSVKHVTEQKNNSDTGILSHFSTDITYKGEIWGNLKGGRKTGVTYMDNLGVTVEYQPNFIGWEGGRFWFYMLANQGGSISSLTGDAQGISNIEAVNSVRLFEALYFQQLSSLHTSLMLGIYDVNSEFDNTYTGNLFLNSSHGMGAGFGQSGVTGPSTFPYTSLAFRVRTRISSRFVIKTAIVDGVPARKSRLRGTTVHLDRNEGMLLTGEISFFGRNYKNGRLSQALLTRAIETAPGLKLSVGGWLYSEPRKGFHLRRRKTVGLYRERGVYALANVPLLVQPQKNRRISAFTRVGMNFGRISRFSRYIGGGIMLKGFVPGRSNDKTGVAVATAINSNSYLLSQRIKSIPTDRKEVNLELTHRFFITDWFQIQLDMQYVHNPNTRTFRSDAVVFGTRIMLGLSEF